MTQNKWGFPLIIIAILLVTSLLTVILPSAIGSLGSAFSTGSGGSSGSHIEIPSPKVYPESVTLDVDGYLLGDELVEIPFLGEYNKKSEEERTKSSFFIFGVLTALVVGGLVLFTLPIMGLAYLSTRAVANNLDNKAHEQNVASLKNKASEWYKEKNKAAPVTGKPETHNRPKRDGWAAGFMVAFLAYLFGYTLGEGISSGSGPTVALVCLVLGIIGSYIYFRPARMEAVDATDFGTVNYGTVWVVLSGAIMMGIGVGLMYVVISGGNPFPWLTWEPGPRINWQYFVDWFVDAGLRPSDWN